MHVKALKIHHKTKLELPPRGCMPPTAQPPTASRVAVYIHVSLDSYNMCSQYLLALPCCVGFLVSQAVCDTTSSLIGHRK